MPNYEKIQTNSLSDVYCNKHKCRLKQLHYLSPVPSGTCTRSSDPHAETGNTSIWIDIRWVKGTFSTLTARRTSCQLLSTRNITNNQFVSMPVRKILNLAVKVVKASSQENEPNLVVN